MFKSVSEIVAPDIMPGKVANALARMVRTRTLNLPQAHAAFEVLQRYPIAYLSSRQLLEKAFALSLAHNHGVFDCLYLAAAQDRDTRLISMDERLIAKFSTIQNRWQPVHLRDWSH